MRAWWALFVLGCAAEAPSELPEPRFDFGCPNETFLACTGLYGEAGEHWSFKRPGLGVEPFEPGVELWSDHMDKRRFVWLPPGGVIDATDADSWQFPVGTKFWKEFSYEGRRIETRYLEKRAASWFPMTFRWTSDESNALALTEGELNVPGTFEDRYEVPRTQDCQRCHRGAEDHVLGFSAVIMADPNATGLTVDRLEASGRLAPPVPRLAVPGTRVAQTALRYLHVNCGVSCHNSGYDSEAWWTGFTMKLEAAQLATVSDTAVFQTGVWVPSYVPDAEGRRFLMLLAPGEPEQSAVVFRATQRDSSWQMPPLATHSVDEAGVAAVKAWIASLPR